MSFVQKLTKSGALPIHLVRGKDASGRACYFFLMCSDAKANAVRAIKDGVFDLQEYGKILASGFGHTPSAAHKKMLLEVYGFDADTLQ